MEINPAFTGQVHPAFERSHVKQSKILRDFFLDDSHIMQGVHPKISESELNEIYTSKGWEFFHTSVTI